MEIRITIILLLAFASFSVGEILFVHEICRHGARAPEIDYPFEGFPNGKGMLTASGFRQHYLIGAQLKKQYVKENDQEQGKLLSPIYNSDEIYIRSTQYQRTIQSAEAQMLGLYPLGTARQLNPETIQNGLPHISIHDEDEILKKLSNQALQGDYQPIPIHNFGLYNDAMTAYGDCPFMVNDYLNRTDDPKIWKKYDDHFRPLIFDQIAKAFNISSEDVNFQEIYPLSDILWAEDFQGIQNRYKFTAKEWEIVKQIQLPCLVELLSDTSNRIMVSRLLNPVVETMKARIGLPYNETLISEFKDVKFLFFSSHDYQLSHVLRFLKPQNVDIKWIEYASVMLIELHKIESPGCKYSKSKNCHLVKVFFNDSQLQLPGCKGLDCYFDEFENYIKKTGMGYEEMEKICHSEPPLLTEEKKAKFDKFFIS
jgi:hypothetical protein